MIGDLLHIDPSNNPPASSSAPQSGQAMVKSHRYAADIGNPDHV